MSEHRYTGWTDGLNHDGPTPRCSCGWRGSPTQTPYRQHAAHALEFLGRDPVVTVRVADLCDFCAREAIG